LHARLGDGVVERIVDHVLSGDRAACLLVAAGRSRTTCGPCSTGLSYS
jgi:hypothetical protein